MFATSSKARRRCTISCVNSSSSTYPVASANPHDSLQHLPGVEPAVAANDKLGALSAAGDSEEDGLDEVFGIMLLLEDLNALAQAARAGFLAIKGGGGHGLYEDCHGSEDSLKGRRKGVPYKRIWLSGTSEPWTVALQARNAVTAVLGLIALPFHPPPPSIFPDIKTAISILSPPITPLQTRHVPSDRSRYWFLASPSPRHCPPVLASPSFPHVVIPRFRQASSSMSSTKPTSFAYASCRSTSQMRNPSGGPQPMSRSSSARNR